MADDWPRWRGPDLNGISRETGWSDRWPDGGPPVLWRAAVGTGYSSFAVAGGRAYTIGNKDNTDTVWCFDAANGKVLWKHAYKAPLDAKFFPGGPTSTPAIDGDRVYTLSRQGKLFCFDAATGQVHWTIDVHEQAHLRVPTWGFAGSPLVHGDLLLLNVGDAGAAVDKHSGRAVWKSADLDAGYATPVPFQRGQQWCAAIMSAKSIVAVNIADGKELWRYRWITQYGVNAADPIISGEHVLVASGYGKGSTLLKMAGDDEPQEVWRNKSLRCQTNSGVLIAGHVYGFDGNVTGKTTLRCVELSSGEVKWEQPIQAGAVTAAGDRLIVLSAKGELIVAKASPTGFEPTARAHVMDGTCWTVPVLANGRIYCRGSAGDVVCLDVRAAAAPRP